ncbi:sperm-associated antigen 5 isoform X2 [Phalacrocorax carbo]|uniref:sperm-associated antigen 5 isoform X2 n=1 Tax=Phalacrocorax carbo TaxID=9209 RepID=UPI003119499E
MRAAQIPAAQQRPRRAPLQELRLQPGAERTSLTPLFRRLRLKDNDCATPVSCTRGTRSSIIPVPCTPGPPRSAILLPSSSTTLVPHTLESPSSTIAEPPGTPTLELSTSETPGSPTLKPHAPTTPRNPTLVPSTPEPSSSTSLESPGSSTPRPSTPESPSSTSLEPPGSPIPGPCTPEPPVSTVPAPLCSPIPGSCTPESPSSTVPAPLCSPIPGPCTPEPPVSTVPAPLCSPIPGPCTPESPSSTVPAPLCSPIPGPCTPESPSSTVPAPLCSPIPGPCTPESPSTTVPAPLCSPIPGPSTSESPSSANLEPPGSPIPGPCTPESPSSTVPAPLCSPIPGPSTPKSPSSTVPAPLCSPVLGLCTPEPPSSTTAEPCTPGSPGIISSAPCTPNSLGSTTLAPCTPGPPGTSSTPQEATFHGWRVAHADLSCSPLDPEPPSGGGSVGPLPCQDTPQGAESLAPAPLEQGPPTPPHTKAGGSERAGPEATATTTPLPVAAPAAVSWMLPLMWLEKSLNTSSLLESLRHSLPLPRHDAGTSVTPVPTAVAGTSVTPVPTAVAGTSVTPVPTAVAGTSVTPVPTVVAGTSMTPVPTVVAGTSVTSVPTAVAGTSVTPVPTAVTGTFMTPRDLREMSTNTSMGGPPCAKDSAAETDSLLWHCPREQLKSLPRAELEGRLESTLIIIEALSLQLRDWQESQRPLPSVGPAEQRDVLTQTDVTHPKGEEEIYRNLYFELWKKTEALQRQRGAERDLQRELELTTAGTSAWSRQCLLFRGLADAAFQSLQDEHGALDQEQEQVRALVSRCRTVLESVPNKLRSCLEERDAMRQRADEALRAKEEGDRFLEAFRAHASARISARDQSLASQRELGTLLVDAIDQQASLVAETQPFREFIDVTFENLEEERRALDAEREQARALVSRCRAVLESVPDKLRSCLEERDATRQRAGEALQAKEEASCQLEEASVALRDAVAQLEQLTVANSRLSTDLSSLMKNLANVEQERDALQQENEKQWEEMAWLARERDTLQQECNGLCQELREATECREFLDQENCMSRTQLLEVEARLKSSLAALQEHNLQYEELMDSHLRLREEQAALSKELESTKAELLDLHLKREKVSWCSTDITESKMRLQELADCLRVALQEEDDAPLRSRAWTPAPRTPGWQTPRRAWTPACRTPACRTPYCSGGSFVGSVLKAVSGKDASEAAGGGSAFTKDKPASTPKPLEPEDGLLESVKELRTVVSDLAMLSSRIQDLEQSEFKALQTEISDLELRLETVTAESQEKMDAQAATIAKLNKALRGKLENEKELQDVVKQQEEKMLQLIDKSGEVTRLKGEISQLKRSLQRAETEAKVLWEEMRGQEPKVDAAYVQERVLLRQEVDKLRLLLLEKEDENLLLSDKYLEQVQGLEMRLHHAQKVLRTHEEMQEKMKEVLLAMPDVAASCQELHGLLRYLGLKPASGSKEAAEPL